MNFFISYLVAGLIMFGIDIIWLGLLAKKFYRDNLGSLLLDKPNLSAAAVFYALYVLGIVVFCITPALDKQSWMVALRLGALFGLIAYATYDLTNLATLKGFPVKVVFVDLLWGVFITASVATLSYMIVNRWFS